jgi:cytoskeletal protein RodZ
MTSNEVKALGRSQRRNAHGGLRLLIAALSLSIALLAFVAAPVLAVETSTTTTSSTSTGYSQTPKPPEEKKVAPAKEEKKVAPEKEVAPAKETTPAVSTTPAKATELPFTGLDLRWIVGGGLLLIAVGGVSLGAMRRHERHDMGR